MARRSPVRRVYHTASRRRGPTARLAFLVIAVCLLGLVICAHMLTDGGHSHSRSGGSGTMARPTQTDTSAWGNIEAAAPS